MIVKEYHTVNLLTGTTSIMQVNHSHKEICLYVTNMEFAERAMYSEQHGPLPRYFNRQQRKAIMNDLIKRHYKIEYKKWGMLQ